MPSVRRKRKFSGTDKSKKTPAGEGERFVEKENLAEDYFCASVRRFTTIPEKRTM